MVETAHNVMICETGHCPWCGSESEGDCTEPNGTEEVWGT